MALSDKNMSLLIQKLKDVKKVSSLTGPENNLDTWEQIGRGAKFDELGFSTEGEFKEWILENPYNNL